MIRPALLLAFLAAPAAAQDLAQQYAAAHGTFLLSSEGWDSDAAAQTMAALLPTLEGRWAEATVLSNGGPDLPAETMPSHCERNGRDLARTSPYGFEMRGAYGDEGGVLVERFDYAGHNTFLASVDQAALLDRLGFGADSDRPPPSSVWFAGAAPGFVALFHPSPDVIVLQGERRPAQIWLRCPPA
jgi:hypothetical protein